MRLVGCQYCKKARAFWAYDILAVGTIKSKGCIDEICRALGVRWNKEHQHDLKDLKAVLKSLKDLNVEILFGDARDGNVTYYFDKENGNQLIFQSRLSNTPRSELSSRRHTSDIAEDLKIKMNFLVMFFL